MIKDISERYQVSSRHVAAIAMQESGYTLDAKHCYKIRGKIRCDFCMMQINDRTIKNFGFDKERLMMSESYCLEAGAKVLADLKHRFGKREKYFWTRYNAVSKDKRKVYQQLVERFL